MNLQETLPTRLLASISSTDAVAFDRTLFLVHTGSDTGIFFLFASTSTD